MEEHVEMFGNHSINMVGIDHPIKTWLDDLIIVSFKLFGLRCIVDIIPDLGFGCIDIQIVDHC